MSPASRHTPGRTANRTQVAVVGCGRWGRNLLRNFHYLGFLRAACDLDPGILRELRQQYPGLETYAHYAELLADPALDGVVISTPSHTHYALARQALEAGKHVYVEKPVATSCGETLDLFTRAQELDRVLMVGHLLLYHPAVNRLKQLIAEGMLGEIRYIQSDRLNYNPHRQDRNVIWDLAPHDLSMLCYLLDAEPEAVTAVSGHDTTGDGKVDVAHLELRFPGGVAGHIHNSWVHPAKQVRLVVRGTERSAVIDDTLDGGKLQLFTVGRESGPPLKEYPEYLAIEPLKLECQHFINVIRSGRAPKTDGYNGYTVVKVLEAAEELLSGTPAGL